MQNLGYILLVAQAPVTLVDFAGEFFLEMRQNVVFLRRSDGCVNGMKAALHTRIHRHQLLVVSFSRISFPCVQSRN